MDNITRKNKTLYIDGPRCIGYEEAYETQLEYLRLCYETGGEDNFLMVLEHPPVITVGRSGGEDDILLPRSTLERKGVELRATNRGGRATLHCPGQLVIYPIINLAARGKDLHRYLRDLENWLIALLDGFGIDAGADSPHTGVWVGEGKIASIGIAVKHWISYHGIALNVNNDLSLFDTIVPCGLNGVHMTSMSEVLGEEMDLTTVAERSTETFAVLFGFPECKQVGGWEFYK
jgi:lipoate-protein ligase B